MNPSYRWAIVAIGALMTCVALGVMFSLAVFLDPLAKDTGWSRAGISAAMTLNFLVMGAGAFGWGALSDRFGTRVVVLIGAVLLGLAMWLASRAESLLQFQLTYGILIGLAASTFFAPMIALTTSWFDTRRSLAVSLVSAGMGVAPMTISPFARWLISTYDWRTAMVVIGVMAWAPDPGACNRFVSLGQRAGRVLRARRDLRYGVWRRHAALRSAGAGLLQPANHGDSVRSGDDVIEPRDVARPARGWLDLRYVRGLFVDVRRIICARAWGHGAGIRLSAVTAAIGANTPAGLRQNRDHS
jgi:MFS family permease